MSVEAAFWDSSALTCLFVPEASTVTAGIEVQRLSPVVWWGTFVEIHGAIARLHRFSHLGTAQRDLAVERLIGTYAGWREILPSDAVRVIAGQLLDRYPLRAADALQLGAALLWCDRRPTGFKFVCRDARLSVAAGQAGFAVVGL